MEERTKNLYRHPCFTVRVVFSWQFFTILEAPWFRGFPNHNRHLSLPSLLTHSSTVSLSLECFPPWQNSPLYTKVSTYPAIGCTNIIYVQLVGYNFRFFPWCGSINWNTGCPCLLIPGEEQFPILQMSTPYQFFSSCTRYHISLFVGRSRPSWRI